MMQPMTLLQRLMLILLLSVSLLVLVSAWVIISNARATVNEELDSTARVAIQLISASLASLPDDEELRSQLRDNLQQLPGTRHLQIGFTHPASGASIWTPLQQEEEAIAAPAWFVSLVEPSSREFRQRLSVPGQQSLEIILQVDPADEIEETWEESRVIVLLILAFTVCSLLLVAFTVRRALRPLDQISEALHVVAAGDFSARVEKPNLPDLGRLTDQFNQMASTLEEQRKTNQGLHGRMLQIQETERRMLAQDLHDELGQSITAIRALAVTGAGSQSQSIVEVCGQMYESVRSLMHQLRPPLLDELGLESALEKLVDDWNGVHEDSFCALDIQGDFSAISEVISIHLFRCVQEGLNNVAKHAKAERVDVGLTNKDGNVALSIIDNGCGFELSNASNGMGLVGMSERAEACGGIFSLVSSTSKGVSLGLNIPFASSELS